MISIFQENLMTPQAMLSHATRILVVYAYQCCLLSAGPLEPVPIDPEHIYEVVWPGGGKDPIVLCIGGEKDAANGFLKAIQDRHRRALARVESNRAWLIVKMPADKAPTLFLYPVKDKHIWIASDRAGLFYLLKRETFLDLLSNRIEINWDKWGNLRVLKAAEPVVRLRFPVSRKHHVRPSAKGQLISRVRGCPGD